MSLVTMLWSMGAASAFTLAVVVGLAWFGERQDLARPVFLLLALSVIAAMRCEVGMMHAATAAEYGQWLRWYHLPAFCVILGYLFLSRLYLGTGRLWLAWTIVCLRLVILATNFLVYPNANWSEIDNLRHVSFLGEQVSVPGDIVVRWQWISTVSFALMFVYAVDACLERLRRPEPDSRRRVFTIVFVYGVPMITVTLWSQSALLGLAHLPVVASPWFLFTLSATAFKLSREIVQRARTSRELLELRSEFNRVGRVTTLGQLAATLAHELAQPLTAIRSNIEEAQHLLQAQTPNLTELRTIVTDLLRDDGRVGEMIDRMRRLIRRRSIEMQPMELNQVVQDVVSLVHSEAVARHVTVSCALQPGLPLVSGDRVHISQVLLNLVINGMDAMQTCATDSRSIVIEAQTGGPDRIEISVRDSGPGISEGLIDRVFEPFFTTKSSGMGMGLAVSRTIIESHGGRLWVERSGEGTGTTFRFTLLRAQLDADATPEADTVLHPILR